MTILVTSPTAREAINAARERDHNFNLQCMLKAIEKKVATGGMYRGRIIDVPDTEDKNAKAIAARACRWSDIEQALKAGGYTIERTEWLWGWWTVIKVTKKEGP